MGLPSLNFIYGGGDVVDNLLKLIMASRKLKNKHRPLSEPRILII
jgi:hypothetical protein